MIDAMIVKISNYHGINVFIIRVLFFVYDSMILTLLF